MQHGVINNDFRKDTPPYWAAIEVVRKGDEISTTPYGGNGYDEIRIARHFYV